MLLTRCRLGLAAAVSVLPLLADPAAADPQTVSRLGWVLNGSAQAAAQLGNTLYAGGTFTRVAPASGALGAVFDLSLTTGAPTSLLPLVDGVVHAIEPDGSGGYYIGGAFTTVAGVPRANLAHILSDGTTDPAFTPPTPNGAVMALARGSTHLFIGGAFRGLGTEEAPRVAVLNPVTGSRVTSAAGAVGEVERLIVSGSNVLAVSRDAALPGQVFAIDQATLGIAWSTGRLGTINDAVVAGTRLIVGGRFLAGGELLLAAIDAATGVVDASWAPSGPVSDTSQVVESLAVSGTTLYIGGTFSSFKGQPRSNAAAIDVATTDLTAWAPIVDQPVSALAISVGGTILLGGNFARVNGEAREDLAEVDAGGVLSAWIANAYTAGVRTLRVVGSTLAVGAHLGVTGGEARTNLVAFDLGTDALLPWAPAMSDDVIALAVANGSVFIGASRLLPGPNPSRLKVVSAVNAVTGANDPRPLPSPTAPSGLALLGADGPFVYLASTDGLGLRRFDASNNAMDPSWQPGSSAPARMTISGQTMYIAGFGGVRGIDLRSGARSNWVFPVPPANSAHTRFNGLDVAVDGRTVYGYVQRLNPVQVIGESVVAVDAVSGRDAAAPGSFAVAGRLGALAVADGQLIAGLDNGALVPFGNDISGKALVAYFANGQPTSWNPGYTPNQVAPYIDRGVGLLVTPTDVVALGYNAAAPVPVQGIAVLARTPAIVPTSLRADVVDNTVTLQWDHATPLPSGYVIEAGTQAGAADILSYAPPGPPASSLLASAGNGTYFVRARNANPGSPAEGVPTNEIALVIGCQVAPAPPTRLAAAVSGANVTLSWWAPPFSDQSSYVIEAGLTAGATEVSLTTMDSSTNFSVVAPPGTFHVRVRARNACGLSFPSSEIFFTVGGAGVLPPPVQGLSAIVNGSNVGIQWTPVPGALGYVLEAGAEPGWTALSVPTVAPGFGIGAVPPGRYYVRVRAVNATGVGAASDEVIVNVVP